MQNLTRANEELFRREPDETYATFEDLFDACARSREDSRDRWAHPTSIGFTPLSGRLGLKLGDDGTFRLNDWSFSQVSGEELQVDHRPHRTGHQRSHRIDVLLRDRLNLASLWS
jgi:hypothetical protein